jgi:hypothetical protein
MILDSTLSRISSSRARCVLGRELGDERGDVGAVWAAADAAETNRACLKVSSPTASPGGLARRGAGNQFAASSGTVAGVFSLREPMRSVCGHPGRSHPEGRFR